MYQLKSGLVRTVPIQREPINTVDDVAQIALNKYIKIRHPGYDSPFNELLALFAPDTLSDGTKPGLYAQLCLDACAIVANNRFDGFLSEQRDYAVAQRHKVNPDSILRESNYYFHVPLSEGSDNNRGEDTTKQPYEIVPGFRQWVFPHDQLPNHWKRENISNCEQFEYPQTPSKSQISEALDSREPCCRMSGFRNILKTAQFCPESEDDWWDKNIMWNYIEYPHSSLSGTTSTSNALRLREDLHTAFDRSLFVFVPKIPSVEPRNYQLVTHLCEINPEYQLQYHNKPLLTVYARPEALFARFAYTIFTSLKPFFAARVPRRLALRNDIKADVDDEGFVSGERCKATYFHMEETSSSSSSSKPHSSGRKSHHTSRTSYGDGNATSDLSSDQESQCQSRPTKRHRTSHDGKSKQDAVVQKSTIAQTPPQSAKSIKILGSDHVSLASDPLPDPSDINKVVMEYLEKVPADVDGEWQAEMDDAKEVWDGRVMINQGGNFRV